MIGDIEVLHQFSAFWTPKNWFLGQKGEILKIRKFSNLAHFWGFGALIMLPQGQEDVCVQRGTPDDDFEYWTASVPCRGAKIWAAKVFFRNFGKCNFYHLNPSWCVYITKMVLSGTNWSHMENNDHCWSFWGYLTGKKLVLSWKLLKNTTEKGQNQANPDRPFSGPIYHTNCPVQ